MARRRKRHAKVGKMGTGATVALVGGGLLVGYMLLRRSTTPTVPTTVYVPVNSGNPNQTGQIVNAASSTLQSLFGYLFT